MHHPCLFVALVPLRTDGVRPSDIGKAFARNAAGTIASCPVLVSLLLSLLFDTAYGRELGRFLPSTLPLIASHEALGSRLTPAHISFPKST